MDLKHCHGYLGHEFLSAVDRPGRYGGSFENRTRFLRRGSRRSTCESAPGLDIAVRVSAFDLIPSSRDADGAGVPIGRKAARRQATAAFGGDGTGLGLNLTEPKRFLDLLAELGIHLVCITGGSPYYNPHIQRPALFPPSDGYQPPEDPLAGVARQIPGHCGASNATGPTSPSSGPGSPTCRSGCRAAGQRLVRDSMTDFVGLGRMVLAYPEMPADVLAGRPLDRKHICRTFSDCICPAQPHGVRLLPAGRVLQARPEAEQLAC